MYDYGFVIYCGVVGQMNVVQYVVDCVDVEFDVVGVYVFVFEQYVWIVQVMQVFGDDVWVVIEVWQWVVVVVVYGRYCMFVGLMFFLEICFLFLLQDLFECEWCRIFWCFWFCDVVDWVCYVGIL